MKRRSFFAIFALPFTWLFGGRGSKHSQLPAGHSRLVLPEDVFLAAQDSGLCFDLAYYWSVVGEPSYPYVRLTMHRNPRHIEWEDMAIESEKRGDEHYSNCLHRLACAFMKAMSKEEYRKFIAILEPRLRKPAYYLTVDDLR